MSAHTETPWAAFSADGHTNIVAVVPRTTCVFSLPGRDKADADVKFMVRACNHHDALFRTLTRLLARAERELADPEDVDEITQARAALKLAGEA